jgi:hypothetical protein
MKNKHTNTQRKQQQQNQPQFLNSLARARCTHHFLIVSEKKTLPVRRI